MVTLPGHHIPVLADTIARLAAGSKRAVDATVGDAGHANILVEAGAHVLGFDRDPEAVAIARRRLDPTRATVLEGRFADQAVLERIAAFQPDLALLDLGVSSRQLDSDLRGFSFRPGVRLDMRMGPGPQTAADVLNGYPTAELARLFRDLADEPRAHRLARAIARRREHAPFTTSDDLVGAIRAALGPRSGPGDFARLFQAVRMEVNAELAELTLALPAVRGALVARGILAVISYHSGEDRVVKHQFQTWARACVCPPHQPVCTCRGHPLGTMQPKRPIRPGPTEVQANPRARSARLRVFRKSDAA